MYTFLLKNLDNHKFYYNLFFQKDVAKERLLNYKTSSYLTTNKLNRMQDVDQKDILFPKSKISNLNTHFKPI